VGDRAQAGVAGPGEDPLELARRVAALAGVEADAGQLGAERHRRLEGRQRVRLGEVAQEAEDQLRGDAVAPLAVGEGAADAADDRLHRHAAHGVGLRVEEDLGVDHVVGGGAAQVGRGHVVEVTLGAEHVAAGVIDVEERLQIGKVVGRAQGGNVRKRQLHPVALGEGEDVIRLERALDVEVQLDLGQTADEIGDRRCDRHGGRA
jgi:hypothetical protein